MSDVEKQHAKAIEATEEQLEELCTILVPIFGDRYQYNIELETARWEMKWDEGEIKWARVKTPDTTYIYSSKSTPSLEEFITAMESYPAFIEKTEGIFDSYLDSLSDFAIPELEDELVAKAQKVRDEYETVHSELVDNLDAFSEHLHEVNSGYGTHSITINDETWELKYTDSGTASYLRIGGRGGTYLHGKYGPPRVRTFLNYREEIKEYLETLCKSLDLKKEQLENTSFVGTDK